MTDEATLIDSETYEQFLTLFTQTQWRLLGYIRTFIHDHTAASDVFQETSLVLWRSFPSYQPEMDFAPWALGITRHQVLKHWRTRDRDRHVFSEAFMNDLTQEALLLSEQADFRLQALQECTKQLTSRQQDLIQRFYGNNQSASVIATSWNRSVHAVYKALKVLRKTLHECVEAQMTKRSV